VLPLVFWASVPSAWRRHWPPTGLASAAGEERVVSSSTSAASSGSGGSSSWFSKLATSTARAVGHPAAFTIAVACVVVWAVSGPFFGFSDTWQLIINTTTTILTNLIVFLIQNTQNRDTAALQLKIDELIRAHKGAHNAVLDLEELEEADLAKIRDRYEELARRARDTRKGILDEDFTSEDDAEARPR
jgi:low affinity Fe/Cu permease